MKNISNIAVFVMIITALILSGCGGKKMYHLTIKTKDNYEAQDIRVTFDTFDFKFGGVKGKGLAEYAFAGEKHPLPDKATIEWRDKDGKTHKKVVEIKSQVPKSFDEITIILTITSENEVGVSYKNE